MGAFRRAMTRISQTFGKGQFLSPQPKSKQPVQTTIDPPDQLLNVLTPSAS